jgi:hypothetical protein
MKYLKGLFSKIYGLYHLRWQLSAWVMLPFMMLLEGSLPLWGNLMLGQLIGAFIFWEVDKRIFKNHDKGITEKELAGVSTP